MRIRAISAAAVVLVGAGVLAGCSTNVGEAAVIDGQHISESQVSSYLTPNSKPVTTTGTNGASATIPIRSFVVEVLIRETYLQKLLAATPEGTPSAGLRGSLERRLLQGKSLDAALRSAGIVGYSSALEQKLLDAQLATTLLTQEQSSGVDISRAAQQVKVNVTVNPRYGAWDPKTLTLSSDPSAGTPGYLKLQPTPAAGS